MKKIISLTLAFAIFGFSVSAQQNRQMKSHKKGNAMHQGQKKDMMKDLNLSDAQKAQMKTDREANKAKMEALKQQDNLTVKEMRERKAALMQEQKAQMDRLLTAEQKATVAARKTSMEGKRKQMDAKRGADMKDKLGLSNDQGAKLKALNQANQAKIKAIQANASLTQEQKKTQTKAIKEAAKAERQNILTAEQIQKMEAMKKDGKGNKGNMNRRKESK